ncbi:MAG: endonuclease/exonuclease/phosphatase family protein [Alphaproteobacteria bacterium]|nr:endonuclease/exonuclease/phosphatase family protein [Alphaproteobacteria bacterium]
MAWSHNDRRLAPLRAALHAAGRSWWVALGLVSAGVGVVPPSAVACDDGVHLDVITLNAWGLPPPLAPHRHARMAAIARWIDHADPDVVAMQEVWDGAVADLPLAVHRSGRDGDDGLAFAGRLSGDAVDVLHFAHARGFDAFKRKGALRTQVRLGETEVWLVVTHLQAGRGAANALVREAQLDELLAWMAPLQGPVILLGDLNIDRDHGEDAPAFARLAGAHLDDVAEGLGVLDATYPGDGRRYDRILLRRGTGRHLVAEAVQVVHFDAEDGGDGAPDLAFSDHRPVRARLRLVDDARP